MRLLSAFSKRDGSPPPIENPQAATKLADGVEACYEALADFPAAHELCRDLVLVAH